MRKLIYSTTEISNVINLNTLQVVLFERLMCVICAANAMIKMSIRHFYFLHLQETPLDKCSTTATSLNAIFHFKRRETSLHPYVAEYNVEIC